MHRTFFLLLLPAIAIAVSETEVIERLLHHYDKRDPPGINGPTEVHLGMYITNIAFHGEEATVTMYLRQSWNDARLAFQSTTLGRSSIRIYAWDRIWVPDTFFRDDLYSFAHDQTVPNKFMKLNSTGGIWYVMKISMRLPIRQTGEGEKVLHMMAESFGYKADTMYFSPLETALDVSLDIHIPIGALVDKTVRDCSATYTAGTYPCLDFQLKFHPTSVYMKEHDGDWKHAAIMTFGL